MGPKPRSGSLPPQQKPEAEAPEAEAEAPPSPKQTAVENSILYDENGNYIHLRRRSSGSAKRVSESSEMCRRTSSLPEDCDQLRRFVRTEENKAARKRRQAAELEFKNQALYKEYIEMYDWNNSGRLERDQLIKMLTDADSSTPGGAPPTEEQVKFLLRVADKNGDGCIDATEVQEMLGVWQTFVDHRAEFDEKLEKYDVSRTGHLLREEVVQYLVDLNGGLAVTSEEVDMVMKQADVLGDGVLHKIELQRATAIWYAYVECKGLDAFYVDQIGFVKGPRRAYCESCCTLQ